jgi:UDP-2-acetamido-3-amino-2,3-dideoxy-glucuronate N-acetyltransferase
MDQTLYYVHPSSYVDDDVQIGKGTKVWHFCHIQGGTVIGENCVFGQNVNIGNHVKIGNQVKIQNNVSVYEGVELEDYVFCGPSMVFTNIMNPRCEYPQRGSQYYLKTMVKKSASLGANCTIVCGHTIGAYAFVGAGTVVTKNVPDYAMVVGNPGRIIGWMCNCGTKLHLSAQLTGKEHCQCKNCQRTFEKSEGLVKEVKDL